MGLKRASQRDPGIIAFSVEYNNNYYQELVYNKESVKRSIPTYKICV